MCCDQQMVEIMETSLAMAEGIFGRCPTCFKNFQKSICSFNCSPKQSEFLKGNLTTIKDDGKTSKALIDFFLFLMIFHCV